MEWVRNRVSILTRTNTQEMLKVQVNNAVKLGTIDPTDESKWQNIFDRLDVKSQGYLLREEFKYFCLLLLVVDKEHVKDHLRHEFGWFQGGFLGLGINDITANIEKEADDYVDRLWKICATEHNQTEEGEPCIKFSEFHGFMIEHVKEPFIITLGVSMDEIYQVCEEEDVKLKPRSVRATASAKLMEELKSSTTVTTEPTTTITDTSDSSELK